MNAWRDRLASGIEALAVDASPAALAQLERFVELLQKWNRSHNLTAIRDADDIVTRHLLDSLSILPWLHGTRVVDVGTGAGLPGLVLAIASPGHRVTLLDANAKKTEFCAYVVDTLGLHAVEVVHARSEHYRPQAGFDTVVSRAFAVIETFIGQAGHLCGAGGRMLAMKGRSPDKELERLPAGWCTEAVHSLEVPGLDAARHLVVVKREKG